MGNLAIGVMKILEWTLLKYDGWVRAKFICPQNGDFWYWVAKMLRELRVS
jgi:hypothetical protein